MVLFVVLFFVASGIYSEVFVVSMAFSTDLDVVFGGYARTY